MRIRTMIATAVGATVGAGAMYLLDPVHGSGRRRELARVAVARGRTEVVGATRDLGARASRRARVYAEQARSGFAETATEPPSR
ncbi:MAG: hypothetical protein KY457_13145 [Actinobacteria bacterium]|nr:hypothetical protein [Actinomycetota bacterium]